MSIYSTIYISPRKAIEILEAEGVDVEAIIDRHLEPMCYNAYIASEGERDQDHLLEV